MMHQFRTVNDISRWQVTTDRVLGGSSVCSFSLHREHDDSASTGLFQGIIEADKRQEGMRRGGFAAVRTKASEPPIDVRFFRAFEIRIRTDGRPYYFNVNGPTALREQLFQSKILAPADKWVTLALPFQDFVLTSRGAVMMHQYGLFGPVEGFGVLLADGLNGPFQFEIDYIKAIRDFDSTRYKAVGVSSGRLMDNFEDERRRRAVRIH